MPNRRRFLAIAATVAAACSTPAFAVGGLVDLELIDRSVGEALPTYAHRGTTWVAGRPGSRYAVRLTNRSGARMLVVLSVDGVNAVSGETAATGQTGYVLGPWQTTEITGWRKSLTEAAAFYFTALPDSYAARTDRPDHVGVIGVAVFREREREVLVRRPADAEPRVAQGAADRERAAESSAAPAPSAKAVARDERLGTGHGEREYAPTTQTQFERASDRPAEVVRLRYDSVENLVAAGVVGRPRRGPFTPDPFPGFVPDPKG
ncbi:MAG: hypothetical protein ABUL50_04200 [Rhizobacter sp.]